MRMRRKPNLIPRMERCADVHVTEPAELRTRWKEEFSTYKEIRLELGCGKGRFTAEQARRDSDVLLLAIEKDPSALVMAMERIQNEEIPNVRFMEQDAADLREFFAPGEISRIYINFPDPWRKTRQHKRRLTAPSFLEIYKDLLPEGGQVWFKTDNEPLFEWSMETFAECGWKVEPMPEGSPLTDYEAKFMEMGLPIHRVVATRP